LYSRRAMVLGVLCLLLSAAVGYGVCKLPPVLWAHAQQWLQKNASIQLDAQKISMQWFSPGLVLQGVQARSKSPSQPWEVRIETLRVQVAWWPYWKGRWRVSDILLEGVHTSPWDVSLFKKTHTQKVDVPLDILHAQLKDVHLEVFDQNRRVSLEKASLVWDGEHLKHHLVFACENIRYVLDKGVFENAHVRVQGDVAGDMFDPSSFDIETADIKTKGSYLQVSGHIPFKNTETWDAKIHAEGGLGAWGDVYAPDLLLEGNAVVDMVLLGRFEQPHVRYKLEIEHTVLKNQALGHVWTEGVYKDNRLNVELLDVDEPHMGHVSGSFYVDLKRLQVSSIRLSLEHTSLGRILDVAGVENPWVDMDVSGSVLGEGAWSPLQWHFSTHLKAQSFDSYTAPFASRHKKTVLHLENVGISGKCVVSAQGALLSDVLIEGKGTALHVQGSLSGVQKKGMDLKVKGVLDMGDIQLIASVPFAGKGPVDIHLHGAYNALTIEGPLHFKGFSFLQYQVGEVSAQAHFLKDTLLLTQTHLGPLEAPVGFGELKFVFAENITLDSEISLSKANLSWILRALRWDEKIVSKMSAEVSGVFKTQGPLNALQGGGSLGTDMLYVEDHPLGPSEVTVRLSHEEHPLHVDMAITSPRGAFSCVYALHGYDGQMSLTLKAYGMDMAMLSPFVGNMPLSGTWSGKAFLQGTFENMQGDAEVVVQSLEASGLYLGETSLRAHVEQSRMEWWGSVLASGAQVRGDVEIGGTWQHHAQAQFNRLEANRMLEIPYQTRVLVSGSMQTWGPLIEPEQLQATWQVQECFLNKERLQAFLRAPVVVQYHHKTYFFPKTEWYGSGFLVRLEGNVEPSVQWDLFIESSTDMSLFEVFQPQLTGMRGPVSVKGAVKGAWSEPDIVGEAQWQQGTWLLPYVDQSMEQIFARWVFVNRRAVLQKAVARLGGGKVEAEGSVEWPSEGRSMHTDIQAHVKNVVVYPASQMEVKLSGDLDLLGYEEDRVLSGKVAMDTLRYTAHVELERLVPKKIFSPMPFQDALEGHPVHLAIKVEGAKNIVVTSNVLEAELQLDLLVTGTTHRWGLLGTITPQWARAYYRDNVFTVQRASVDFIDEFRVHSQFSVQAKTQACGMTVDVDVEGDSDQFQVYTSGRDEKGVVNTEDVLSCLHLGLRTRDFDSNQTEPAGLLDVGTVGIDALWSVTGLDRRVKKILPIKVDEIRLTNTWSSVSNRTTPHLVVGKELAKRVGVRYSRSLMDEKDQTLYIHYRMTQPLSLQGTWFGLSDVPVGDFGLDLKWHWEMK
jgi:hypothetical protein